MAQFSVGTALKNGSVFGRRQQAAESIAPVVKRSDLIVLESTSPVGTTEQMARWLAAARPDLRFAGACSGEPDVNVAHCPERVLPGHVVRELVENDRTIGGLTEACSRRAVALYRVFVDGELIVTNARTAEMCKLTENSFRDVNIAFANELSLICDQLGIDVWELIGLANRHPRVKILQPGAGVGGHCIAVDPWFIVDSAPAASRIIRTAREVNDSKPHWVLDKIETSLAARRGSGTTPRIAVLGLAFKPNIDDLRESPALRIAEALAQRHPGTLLVVEPNIEKLPPNLGGETLCELDEALERASLIVLLVGHREFAGLGARIPRGKDVIDVVGISGR